jgi:aryl-alcohol dehydrogenase-like predicted oxidoreductase
VQTRTLGTETTGTVAVSAIGLGEMPLSLADRPDERQAVRTIHAALDAGVTFVDTADAYSAAEDDMGHGERLIAKALAEYGGDTGDVLVATKGGHLRTADGGWLVDGSAEHLRRACDASLAALGVDAIGLYQLHWPDPDVPIAESVGALAELQREGKVRLVGVSNFSVEQLEQARGVVQVAGVQNRFSPAHADDRPMLEHCAAHGIAYLSYMPLDGAGEAPSVGDRLPTFASVARQRGVSPHRIVLAWHLAQAPVVIPIPGARRAESIVDSAAAAELELTPEELALLDS